MTRTSGSIGGVTRAGLRSAGVDTQALMCCANRGRIPSTLGSAATTNTVCAESRRVYKTGRAALSEMRLVFANFYVDGAGAVAAPPGMEYGSGAPFSIEAAIEIPGAPNVVVRATFGAANVASVPDGTAEFLSDPLYAWQFGLTEFAAGTIFWVRERRVIAVGQRFARYAAINNSIAGELTKLSDGASASQVMNSGIMTTPTGGSSLSCFFAPSLIVGRAVAKHDIAILAVGDSIMNGANDPIYQGSSDGSDGHGGWFTVGLWNVNGRAVPHCLMAFNGASAVAAMEGPSMANAFAKRRVYLKYFSHAIENLSTNDAGKTPSESEASTYLRRRKLWAALRAGDSRIGYIAAIPTMCRATSTDNWTTIANQTPIAGFATGGAFRDPMIAHLNDALAAREIDGVFDMNAIVADPVARDCWRVDGTANKWTDDGTHLSFHATTQVAAAWTAFAGSLR